MKCWIINDNDVAHPVILEISDNDTVPYERGEEKCGCLHCLPPTLEQGYPEWFVRNYTKKYLD